MLSWRLKRGWIKVCYLRTVCFLGWTSSVLKLVSQKKTQTPGKGHCVVKKSQQKTVWVSLVVDVLRATTYQAIPNKQNPYWWHPCSFESCQVFFKKNLIYYVMVFVFSRYPNLMLYWLLSTTTGSPPTVSHRVVRRGVPNLVVKATETSW